MRPLAMVGGIRAGGERGGSAAGARRERGGSAAGARPQMR